MFYLNPWGSSDACRSPGLSPRLLAGTGDVRRVPHLGLLATDLIKSRTLSCQPSTGDCNFRRNCCASFPKVITWFLLAKSQKPLVSGKVQLSALGGSDLSCDLGLANPEEPSWGQMLQDRRWDSFVGFFNLLQSGRTGQEPQPPLLCHYPHPQTGCPAWMYPAAGDTHEQLICLGPRRRIKTSTGFSRAQ